MSLSIMLNSQRLYVKGKTIDFVETIACLFYGLAQQPRSSQEVLQNVNETFQECLSAYSSYRIYRHHLIVSIEHYHLLSDKYQVNL